MKRMSWKYIAGLIDGEGCIDLQYQYTPRYEGTHIRPRVRVAMATPGKEVIELLAANFGGHIGHRKAKSDQWQDAYSWELCGKQCRPFLQNIAGHLIIKKEQARLAIWWIDNGMGKHVSAEVREHLKQELKAMKRDPQRLSDRAASKLKSMIDSSEATKRWSNKHEACVECESTERPHKARGVCDRCYHRDRYRELAG